MWLVTDLLVHGLGGKVRFLPKRAVLYGAYGLVLSAVVVLAVWVLPPFVSELPIYLERQLIGLRPKLAELGITLDPAFDWIALRGSLMNWLQGHLGNAIEVAERWGRVLYLFAFALILNFLLVHQSLAKRPAAPPLAGSLLRFFGEFLSGKVSALYARFRQVMGAQVVISAINTGLTLVLLIVLGIPHKLPLTVLCFVFGLIPVIGNLVSNVLICLAAFLWSGVWQAGIVLVFLVVIHKLEYFLNSKIIGDRTKLPMALALLCLLVGEAAFHISGMILAIPLALFVRDELAAVGVQAGAVPPRD
jgi:predicted PurR-regulated permease PerM